MVVRPAPPILQDGLPAKGSQDWWTVDRKLAIQLVQLVGTALNPPVQAIRGNFHNDIG